MYYFSLLIILACAAAYYHIGEMEYQKGFFLGAVSLLVSVVTFLGLRWGWLPSIGAQVGIFVVLTVINVCRKGRS
jgi:hypothetical protein